MAKIIIKNTLFFDKNSKDSIISYLGNIGKDINNEYFLEKGTYDIDLIKESRNPNRL